MKLPLKKKTLSRQLVFYPSHGRIAPFHHFLLSIKFALQITYKHFTNIKRSGPKISLGFRKRDLNAMFGIFAKI